ncbi:MAG: tRNA-uridine 2-sulfurtransferase [Solirubrobacteraceae bacterium]|jgi:tRNA-specific 2-thiouridylase|nr:tRNA-uridine 2-sulfurtransferase [Solirubrobacteraceae bacterium]
MGFQGHLEAPVGRGEPVRGGHSGAAGGAACGDLVRISVAVEVDRVAAASFDAHGCGAALAAGSAAVALVERASVLEAARVGPDEISAELGGLHPGKRHAAELAADALARALGAAVREDGAAKAVAGRTLVAMSGGVDSAVAALLCAGGERSPAGAALDASFPVVAVTLELWADPENDGERSCCSAAAVRGARGLAHRMGMAHLTLDLREEFRAGVVDPFVEDHAAGLTPNPCIRCNGHVRLDAMLDFARRLGAPALATGHYARVADDGEGVLLRAAADPAKDQSYMLAALSPDALARMRFPLGELTKPRVRELAARAGLPVASQPDSQDLCFLAGTDRAAFLRRHGGPRERPGDIVDRRGRVLGRHRGHHGYTVGQRKGLGVAATAPLYVLETDARANRVVVGPREALGKSTVDVRGAVLLRDGARVDGVKLRYRSKPLNGGIEGEPGAGRHPRLRLHLSEPVLGAAPGQTAVLLDGDLIVGHATIAG